MIDRVTGNHRFPKLSDKTLSNALTASRFSSRKYQGGAGGRRDGAAERPSLPFLPRSGSCEPSRVADGAPRPARPCQGGCADRCSDWTRVLTPASGCRGAQTGDIVQSALDRLAAARLLFRQGGRQRNYLFKHALVQDAAYGTIARARRALHARIAATLESRFQELLEPA